LILTGLPHSETSGSTFATNYPELFAGDRVLHRHSAPRHPPCALCSLTYKPASSPVIDRLDAIDMNGDRYVSFIRRNSQFSLVFLQLLRCTTRSGARTKTGRACAGTRGSAGTIFAMAAHRGDPALDDQWYGVGDGPVKARRAGPVPRVEPRRLELLTPSLQRRCSTS
jgi:hypothetical protein